MHGFARVTKLNNIGGRANYITNVKKQEEILCKSEPVDWKPYQEYERKNQKTDKPNNEGREVVIALPNEWAKLDPNQLKQNAHQLAVVASGKETDMQWAVHWNENRTNLHMHVIFSERTRDFNPGKWDRNIYQNKDGGVARRKSDRAVDENGSYILLHKKGDLKDGFTAKDPAYATRKWVWMVKEQLKQEFQSLGIALEPPNPLHEYHEGNGDSAPSTRAKNAVIRANNTQIKEIVDNRPTFSKTKIKQFALSAVKGQQVLYATESGIVKVPFENHKKIVELKSLLNKLESSIQETNGIRNELNGCRFYERKKKKQLSSELNNAIDQNKQIRDQISELGVPVKDLPTMEEIRESVAERIEQLKTQALHPEPVKEKEIRHEQPKQLTREEAREMVDGQRDRALPRGHQMKEIGSKRKKRPTDNGKKDSQDR